MKNLEWSDKNIEWAERIKTKANIIKMCAELGIMPDLYDTETLEALTIMCAASSGMENADDEAIVLLNKKLQEAMVILAILPSIYIGKVKPIMKDGGLAFAPGIRADK